jgi:uncharacterized membrane protein
LFLNGNVHFDGSIFLDFLDEVMLSVLAPRISASAATERTKPGGTSFVSLAPLLDAAPQIPLHAFAAMAAFGLGVVQLVAPKGTLPHRTLGRIWVALMATVAASSFWIHQIRLLGPWSPIHLLSIFTLAMVPLGVWKAHRHQVADHRRIMILIFSGALVIAGLFTLLPGRIIHAVVFGN